MEIRQLEYLLAVIDTASFTKAARRLGVAQPSISEQLRKLERELRQPLVDRLPRGIVPTPAGQRLAIHARRILAEVGDATRDAADAVSGKLSGRLAIGAIPTIAPFLLPRLLPKFEKAYPEVELVVTEDTTGRLLDQIASAEIDLAIASSAPPTQHIDVETVADEPLLLMLPARHKLAKSKRVSPDSLADERFVALHEMHCLADQSSRFCLNRELQPPVVMHGSNLATLSAMVAVGMGVSLVPQMMSSSGTCAAKGCTFRPFAGECPTRPLTLIWPLLRHRTLAVRAFGEMARSMLKS